MPTVEDLKYKPKGSSFYMPMPAFTRWATAVFLTMLFLGMLLSHLLVNHKENSLYLDIQNRIEILTQNKTELIQAWTSNLNKAGAHISNADVIRLFVSENDLVLQGNKKIVSQSLADQATYFQVTMDEYVRQNKMASAYVAGRGGEVFIKSSSAAALTSSAKKYVDHVLETGKEYISPLTIENGEILATVVRPIYALDTLNEVPNTVGVLLSNFVVTEDVLHFLKQGDLNKAGEKTHILQNNLGVMQYVALSNNIPTLYTIQANKVDRTIVGTRSHEDFTFSKSMVSEDDVFSATSYVFDTPFIVLQEYNKKAALVTLKEYSLDIHSMMILTIVVISSLVLLMLNYVMNARNRNRVNHQQQVLNALVKAVEIRDPYLSGHHARVARISLDIANQMRLSIPERSTLYYAAMLSGIGKIFISRKILMKPSKLTVAETETLRRHIDHAMEVLGDMEFEFPIAEVIEQMYERIDGTGYPNSKQGAEINFLSRILGACDVYCALTKPRAYREAMSVKKALEVMDEEADKYDKGVMGVLRTIQES